MRLRPALVAFAALLPSFLGGCREAAKSDAARPLVELSIKSAATSQQTDGGVLLRTELEVHYLRCEGAADVPENDEASAMKIPAEITVPLALYYSHLATLRTADGKTFRGQGGTDAQTGQPCVDCSALRLAPCGPGAKETVNAFFALPKGTSLEGATLTYRDASVPVPVS